MGFSPVCVGISQVESTTTNHEHYSTPSEIIVQFEPRRGPRNGTGQIGGDAPSQLLYNSAEIEENIPRIKLKMTDTPYQILGGEARLREIIDAFVERVVNDRMIGFFFRNADKGRIKEMEFQLTAQFLGAPIEYKGLPLKEVHAKHPIMGGQFMRRLQILRETLEEYGVPEEMREAWLSHTESLRPLITQDAGSDCDPDQARKRVLGS